MMSWLGAKWHATKLHILDEERSSLRSGILGDMLHKISDQHELRSPSEMWSIATAKPHILDKEHSSLRSGILGDMLHKISDQHELTLAV